MFILDCSRIAGVYKDGSINISYNKSNLYVLLKNSSLNKTEEKVKPSCNGYIIFTNNERKIFDYDEDNQKIVWKVPDAEDIWIKGSFY